MPRSIPIITRRKIIELRGQGCTYSVIAKQTTVCLSTVKIIVGRYQEHGESGLKPRYANCGNTGIRFDPLTYRQYRAMKAWHPKWGYDRITSLITAKYPIRSLPDRRTVYRWWNALGLVQTKSKRPKCNKAWANKPHQIWQVDAKELIRTRATQTQCWLTIVDEYTGGVINPPVFPPWVYKPGKH